MTHTPRVHLSIGLYRVACGAHANHPRGRTGVVRRSPDPNKVTCLGCAHTVHMADAEINYRTRRRAGERREP